MIIPLTPVITFAVYTPACFVGKQLTDTSGRTGVVQRMMSSGLYRCLYNVGETIAPYPRYLTLADVCAQMLRTAARPPALAKVA